jgi:hypothetical protein
MRDNPEIAAKLENQIRQQAGVVADAMLTGPDNDEEASEALEGPAPADLANDDDVPSGRKSKKSAG